jgi:hypothetical protein
VYRWLARHFIDEDYFACGWFWRSLGRYSLHIALERYFLALEVLRAHGACVKNVLLTDSRDVVLQQNPFARINGGLISGLEERTIGECSINSGWITDVYGSNVHKELSGRRIVCSGVTLGPAAAVERYLFEMCRELWRCLPKVALIAQYDQGIHNYLIYKDRISIDLTDNPAGLIATLHHEDPEKIRTDAAERVITVNGKAPAIVHQYDRHPNLVDFVRARLTLGKLLTRSTEP